MLGLYTPKTIRKVRENVEVKRNFLTELFLRKEHQYQQKK